MVLKLFSSLVFLSCLTPSLFAFVFLSGNLEATLDVSPASPSIVFLVGEQTPNIEEREDFMDGLNAGLEERDYWLFLLGIAVERWNEVADAYIELQIGEGQNVEANSEDNVHSITVGDTNLTAAAFARPKIEDRTIIDCDITISSKSTKAVNLAYTIMHELGHCLGLGHNHSDYDAVMGYSRSSRQMRLGLDDKLGLIYLYPMDNISSPRETLGCATIHSQKPLNPLKIYMLTLLMLMPIGIAFVRRRHL